MKSRDDLVKDIAAEIINDENYSSRDWDSITVVMRFEPPSIWKGGFMYFGDDYERENPESMDLTVMVNEFRNLMTEEDGAEWLSCLIKISARTQEVNMEFEYDEVRRWYMTPTFDPDEIRACAMSLR